VSGLPKSHTIIIMLQTAINVSSHPPPGAMLLHSGPTKKGMIVITRVQFMSDCSLTCTVSPSSPIP
jgi:hypothetical protein